MINNIFQEIFVITKKTAYDRQKAMIKQMRIHNISFAFFDAIIPNHKCPKQQQIIGNRLSHLEIIKYAKNNDLKNVLVFEDDIVIDPNIWKTTYLQNIKNFIDDSNCNWCCFYLGGKHKIITKPTSFPNVRRTYRTIGTHAIAYNNTYYDILIKLFSEEKHNIPVDYYLSGRRNKQNNFLKSNPVYTAYPVSIYQLTNRNIRGRNIRMSFWKERF